MKLIFENWNNFLNEKLMLQPGKEGWDLYSKLVGQAYLDAPAFEERAVSSFQAMKPFVETMFKRISSKIDIEFVDYHPYKDSTEVKNDVKNNRRLQVSMADAEHAIFDPVTNGKFRAIHDYMSHVTALGSRGTEFTLQGEIAAYNVHLKTLPREAIPALFTEVVGQVSAYYVLGGKFAEQKICLLDGFDYVNVGVVDGYDIVNKNLVKK